MALTKEESIKRAILRQKLKRKGIKLKPLKKGPPSIKGYQTKIFKCKTCSKGFKSFDRSENDPKKSKNRFCSRICYNQFKKGNGNPNYKGIRPCKNCGEHVLGMQRVFCNKKCNSDYYERVKKEKLPMERLNRNMRRAVTRQIKIGFKNRVSWRSLVGYDSLDLKKNLESKFEQWMNWDNYGKMWHIDHIRPIVSFNFESFEDEDFKKCWELDNLRPLCAKKNSSKGSYYNGKRIYRNR